MMMMMEGIKGVNNGGRVVGVGHIDEDMADGMQCTDHPYRNNPGGICAFCLQEKRRGVWGRLLILSLRKKTTVALTAKRQLQLRRLSERSRDPDLLAAEAGVSPAISSRESQLGSVTALYDESNPKEKANPKSQPPTNAAVPAPETTNA
uniref:Uncharacterized protein n=1 Tax=Cannabis sativa TaxID=3483 RepID=A0A803Q507_CANSA